MKQKIIDKIHNKLVWKKRKYSIVSLFSKTKTIVLNFLPLEKITSANLEQEIIVDQDENLACFLPKNIGYEPKSASTIRTSLKAYLLKNVFVTGNSTLFMTEDKALGYYEKLHDDNRNIYIYNTKSILAHSETLMRINHHPEVPIDEECIFLAGTFSFNYYHFLLEILAKIEYFKSIPNQKNLSIILNITSKENANLATLVDFFLKEYKKKYVDDFHYYKFKKLWFINTPNPTIPNIYEGELFEANFTKLSPKSIKYLRDVCLSNFDESQVRITTVSKIFMVRKSKFRKYNEEKLLIIAKTYDFEAVYFEDLNIHEQIFLMQNADYVVGASGAAWTNLLFSKPESKGLTWLGTVWGDFSAFATLAELVKFDLNYIRNQSKSNHFHEDYEIDASAFEEHLKTLLSS